MSPLKTAIVIPARFASTRLPGKPLLDATGWPMIRHVYEQARKARHATRIIVATDDERIMAAVAAFGGDAVMTDPDHPTGTDRLAEVARDHLAGYDLVVNVQGDEPELEPEKIDALIELYTAAGDAAMATLVCPFPTALIDGPGSPLDPACVKAVLGAPVLDKAHEILGYQALYFSRSLVPYPRDTDGKIGNAATYCMHIGIYAYSPAFLQTYVGLPQGRLEMMEKLEQLRILENGYRIVSGIVDNATAGIDTRADYDAFLTRWKTRNI